MSMNSGIHGTNAEANKIQFSEFKLIFEIHKNNQIIEFEEEVKQ